MHRIRFCRRQLGPSHDILGPYTLPYAFAVLPPTQEYSTRATPVIPVYVMRLLPPQSLHVVTSDLPSPFGHVLADGLDPNRHCLSFLSALSSHKFLRMIHRLTQYQRNELVEKFRTEFNHHVIWAERDSKELEALQMQYGIAQIIATLAPIGYIPNELLANIFLISVEQLGIDKGTLRLVCQRWRSLTAGLWGKLEVGAWTETTHIAGLVNQGPWFLAVAVDTAMDEAPSIASTKPYTALALAWTSTSRWYSLKINSFPTKANILASEILFYPHIPFKSLKSLSVGPECDSSDSISQIMEVIASHETPNLTNLTFAATMVFRQLNHSHWVRIYSQLKVLVVSGNKIRGPVDLLRHFSCLEILEISGLTLCPPSLDDGLPFLQTLRRLSLKGTTIRWMTGRTFERLESCTLLQPVNPRAISQGSIISLPLCTNITLQSHFISILVAFHAPLVNNIKLECSQWSTPRAEREFDQVWSKRQTIKMSHLSVLFLNILCSDRSLLRALQQMPTLKELSLGLPHPAALRADFFAALCAMPMENFAGRTAEAWRLWARYGTRWEPKICFSLVKLEVRYGRWLRRGEMDVVSPLFHAVAWSREKSHSPLREFGLKLGDQLTLELMGMQGDATFMHFWGLNQGEPWKDRAEEQRELHNSREDSDFLHQTPESVLFTNCQTASIGRFIGFPSKCGSFPFEYIPAQFYNSFFHHLRAFHHHPRQAPIHSYHILPFFKHLEELTLSNFHFEPCPPTADLRLCRTLRRLHICDTPLDWMDGRIFERLVECRIGLYNCKHVGNPSRVGMPSCTKMEFTGSKDPMILTSFRLPSLDSLLLSLAYEERTSSSSATVQDMLLLARSIRPRVLRICMKPKDENLVTTLRSELYNEVVVELSEDDTVEDLGWGSMETELRWQLW